MEIEFINHCIENNMKGVNDCLSYGVHVNTKNYSGTTGLIAACWHPSSNSAIVSRLVQVPGLDINHQNNMGYTAAHYTSQEGNTECVKILVETGKVDWNKRDNFGNTPLYLALEKRHSDIVDIIMEQPNVKYNIKNKMGETLGHAAVLGRSVKCVETLMAQERFDSWNVPDSYYGETPIMKAVKWNYTSIVKVLVSLDNIDYNIKNVRHDTLGHDAVWGGNVMCVETLAAQERCQCWNVPDKFGNTPIMLALKIGKTDIVEILLRCPQVDLSCRDREGWSLVFRAIQRNQLGEKMSNCYGKENLIIVTFRSCEDDSVQVREALLWLQPGPHCCGGGGGGGYQTPGSVWVC